MATPSTRPRCRVRMLVRGALTLALSGALLGTTAPVLAQPANPDDAELAQAQAYVESGAATVAGLANSISGAQEEIHQLELDMGALREAVNKALVDLHDAQANAEQARQAVTAARTRLGETQDQIEATQDTLNEISRSAYRQESKNAAVTTAAGEESAEDALDRRTFLRVNAEGQREVLEELDGLRTRQANEESELRAARDLAEQRETAAVTAKGDTERQIESTSSRLSETTSQRDQLTEQRDVTQNQLDQSRENSERLQQQRAEYEDYVAAEAARKETEEAARAAAEAREEAETEAARATAAAAASEDGEATRAAEQARDEAATAVERENESRELADAAVGAATAATAALVAQSLPSHTDLDSPYPSEETAADVPIAAVQNPASTPVSESATENDEPSATPPGETGPAVPMNPVPTFEQVSQQARETVTDSPEEQIETVISRAKSQIGVPYAWGGGSASGPTQGVRDGGVADRHGDFNKVGFDCSGLVLYAFAGAGVALPHFSGYQYNYGTKVDPGQMQRGDLIFYGPKAEHHVAIYLGDGKMLEAPQSGSQVQISDVRWSGMSPAAVRLI